VLGRRRLDLDRLLIREPDPFRAGWVLLEPLLVEYGGEVLDRLLYRLASLAGRGQLANDFVHVLDRELIHAFRAEPRQHASEGDPVQDPGGVAHVDPRFTLALSRLGKCGRATFGCEQA
jgi:hypothetical protein